MHDVVRHLCRHLAPFSFSRHRMELVAEILEPVPRKDRPISRGRAVKGDALAHPLEGARDGSVVGAGGEKAAARNLEILAAAPSLLEPLSEARHDRLREIFAGAEAVQFDTVACLG